VSKHNNGKDKPYFMSVDLLSYMDSAASNLAAQTQQKK
jgi:hypothetical protein